MLTDARARRWSPAENRPQSFSLFQRAVATWWVGKGGGTISQLTLSETRGQIMPTTLLLAPSNFQTFLRSCSPSSNWSSSFWHEIYLNMNTRQDCWAHDLLGFCLALAFPMYVRQDIFPIFSCCLYNPHNRPDLPAYPSCLTATTIRTLTLCRNFYKVISFDGYILTLLGLGLIKINDVSTNFNNPRPSLILNN